MESAYAQLIRARRAVDEVVLERYADELAAIGDTRAEYTRLQLAAKTGGNTTSCQRALRACYPAEHPRWLAELEQAGVFECNLTGLEAAWWGGELPERAAHGTYERFEYADLPELPHELFNGGFQWLSSTEFPVGCDRCGHEEPQPWKDLLASLRSRGVSVPEAFAHFMTAPELQRLVPSSTSNYFVSADPAHGYFDADQLPPVHRDGARLLPFFSDQQSCVRWGLWLGEGQSRYAPVVSTSVDYEGEQTVYGDFEFAAPTFEAFVYRTWIENRIWYATVYDDTRRPVLDFEQRYIDSSLR